MHFIEITYLLASFVSIFAMLPQIKRLLVAKQSDELSVSTWTIWIGYQAVALMYSIAFHLLVYTIVNIAWISLYTVMLALIIKYRKKPVGVRNQPAYEPIPSDDEAGVYERPS
jgi:uncharacterized protein with PQ loop repeat